MTCSSKSACQKSKCFVVMSRNEKKNQRRRKKSFVSITRHIKCINIFVFVGPFCSLSLFLFFMCTKSINSESEACFSSRYKIIAQRYSFVYFCAVHCNHRWCGCVSSKVLILHKHFECFFFLFVNQSTSFNKIFSFH